MTAELPKPSSRLQGWSSSLASLAGSPLSLKPEFPEIAARWEAWWRFEADRPLFIAHRPDDPSIRWGKAFDLLDDPEAYLDVRRRQVEATHWAGDAVPMLRVDLGPVAMAPFLGAPISFSESEQTSWHEPVWADADPLPLPVLDPENPWLVRTLDLLRHVAADAAGRYLVAFPDLTGAVDTLANLRSSEQLCFDAVEDPDRMRQAADAAVAAWWEVFAAMHDTVLAEGAGVTQWLNAWSMTPHTVPTCDFNVLLGPDAFREVCLPSLESQARLAGRCLFHLDGPQAARHAPALAGSAAITAVQYTPGTATPSALAKLDMLRMLQEHGKPILVVTPEDEIEAVCQALDRRGLALWIEGPSSVARADELAAMVRRFPA